MLPIILMLATIVILILFSAFFSGSETAITSVSKPLVHQNVQKGDKRYIRLSNLIAEKEELIGSILLGNNLVNNIATTIATLLAIKLLGEAMGSFWAPVIITIIFLIFAEILPKTLAVRYSEKLSLIVALPLGGVFKVLRPISNVLLFVTRGITKLFVPKDEKVMLNLSSEDELKGAIDLHVGDDPDDHVTAAHEKIMLKSVLELDDITVGEIMVHRRQLQMIDASLSQEEIISQIWLSPHTRIPLYLDNQDNVIGVIHARDVLGEMHLAQKENREPDPLSKMTQPWFIPESTICLDQLQAFRQRREHFAIVIDEYGALQGIVTLEDILEEIVGDISDEHDDDKIDFELTEDGGWIVSGETTIRDLNRALELNLSDENVTTIAGLLLYVSKRIPSEGQVFRIQNCRITVLGRQRHRLTKLKINKIANY